MTVLKLAFVAAILCGTASPASAQETVDELAEWCRAEDPQEPLEALHVFGCQLTLVATYTMMVANCASADGGSTPDGWLSAGPLPGNREDLIEALRGAFLARVEVRLQNSPEFGTQLALIGMAETFALLSPCEALDR